MIVLVNSSFHNVGVSTLTYMISKMYGNWLNQPTLFMNLGNPSFYRGCTLVENSWESQGVSMVLNKLHGRNAFRPFCYKLEDTVYYYNAVNASLSNQMGIKDILKLLEKANREFGMVVVDVDVESNGFVKLVPSADKVLFLAPPDTIKIKNTADTMRKIHDSYESLHGIAIKPDIIYVLNRFDKSLSLNQAYRLLNCNAADCTEISYSADLAREVNKGRLDYFTADLMIAPRTPELRILNTNIKKLLDKLSPTRMDAAIRSQKRAADKARRENK